MASIPLMFPDEDIESGGKPGIMGDFSYRNNVKNADLRVRLGFLRKVYGLLTLQLCTSVIVGAVCMYHSDVRAFIKSNDWLMILALVMSLVILVALHFKRKETPTNFILLFVFTFIQAYTVGVILTFYDQAIVLQALLLTVSVVAGLTIFTFQSKRDFSFLGSGLIAGLMMLLVAGMMQIIFASSILELGISLAGAFIFSLFIIFDTHMLMTTLSPEEYILATINLYMDIINLFLYILRALEAVRRQ